MRGRASGAKRPSARDWRRSFLRDAPEIFEIPPWPLGWILLGAVLLVAGKSLVTTGLEQLDLDIATHGRVLLPASTIVIAPRESGVIAAVRVREGQVVRRGDLLLQIASMTTAASIDRLQRERRAASMDLLRLDAQLKGDPRALSAPADTDPALVESARWLLATQMRAEQSYRRKLQGAIARDRAQRARLAAEITQCRALASQLNLRLGVEELLVERKFNSDARLSKVQSGLAVVDRKQTELARRLADTDARIVVAAGMLSGAKPKFRSRTLAERAATAERIESTGRDLAQAHRGLRALRAPTDGVVTGLAARAVGDAVTAAQPLMTIFPADAEIELETRLTSSSMRWIVEGQRIVLRLAPSKLENAVRFDGEITWIARDPVEDDRLGWAYPVRIRIARQSILNRSLASALAARAETSLATNIRLDARSMIDLLQQSLLHRRVDSAADVPLAQVREMR